jgi:hypothetical protein
MVIYAAARADDPWHMIRRADFWMGFCPRFLLYYMSIPANELLRRTISKLLIEICLFSHQHEDVLVKINRRRTDCRKPTRHYQEEIGRKRGNSARFRQSCLDPEETIRLTTRSGRNIQ